MRLILIAVLSFGALATAALAASPSGIKLDHAWIMVTANAPERTALERAGFQIAREVNHHEGTGTSSVTVEFEDFFFEMMWVDPAVPVSPGMERALEKHKQRMAWRTSGWCPIGVGFRRTGDTQENFPFPTWTWTADWLPKGTAVEMLTRRDDTRSPALFISPRGLGSTKEQEARAALYHHAAGAKRVTEVRVVSPGDYKPIDALTYLEKQALLSLGKGEAWLLELTFDDGKQGKRKDFRPDLPLVIRY